MSKFTLMIIGTIAIGLFALPGVISTFSGSHDYIAPENVNCMTCHPEVLVELENSKNDHTHANANWTVKETLDCVECHTVSGVGDNPAVGHAAQKVDCDFCHADSSFSPGDYSDWAHAPTSGGATSGLLVEYGMACDDCHRSEGGASNKANMFLDDVYENIIHEDAAHVGFYYNADNDTTLLGGTESCIGCHTHIVFNMTQPLGTSGMTYNPGTGVFGKE